MKKLSTALVKAFKYIEPLWLGNDGKISLRYVLALAFSIDLISNVSYAVRRLGEGRTFSDLSTVLLIEAGLITSLLALRLIQNINEYKTEARVSEEVPPSRGE